MKSERSSKKYRFNSKVYKPQCIQASVAIYQKPAFCGAKISLYGFSIASIYLNCTVLLTLEEPIKWQLFEFYKSMFSWRSGNIFMNCFQWFSVCVNDSNVQVNKNAMSRKNIFKVIYMSNQTGSTWFKLNFMSFETSTNILSVYKYQLGFTNKTPEASGRFVGHNKERFTSIFFHLYRGFHRWN